MQIESSGRWPIPGSGRSFCIMCFGKIKSCSAGGSGKPLSSQLLGRPMCLDLSALQGAPCQLVGWRVHINMGVGLCSALKRGAAANNLRGTV